MHFSLDRPNALKYPYRVMWAQSTHPDNSQIWMTFETATQFPEKGTSRFKVFIEKGKVSEIVELTKEGNVHD